MVFFIFFGGSIILVTIAKQMGYTGRIDVSQFWAGVTAPIYHVWCLCDRSFRMAIQDIPKGQWESAQSIGMTPTQTLTRIILPQMWMVALPGLGNLTLVLLKDTALVSLIGLQDLMYFAQRAAQSTQNLLHFI